MGSVSPASDIYALGVMLAELLSGISPADMEVTEFRLNIEKPLESVPAPVVSLIRRMTTPNASDRLCDYALLRQSFGAFAQNNYTPNALVESSQQSPKEYNHQLKKVERIGQKGNLDLWLQLPEQTPREIPKVYKKTKSCFQSIFAALPLPKCYEAVTFCLNPVNIFFNSIQYFLNCFFLLISCIYFLLICFVVYIIPVLVVYIIPILIFRLLWAFLEFGFLNDLSLWFWNGMMYYIDIIICSGSTSSSCASSSFTLIDFLLQLGTLFALFMVVIIPKHRNIKKFQRSIQNIIKNGRKSLATVRDVQYRSNSKKQYPEFVLQYAFNPPDDSEPGDLTHEVVVPYDPALKPGDVLPILYTISEDNTEVMSMPFPFPTKALPELSSCYCKTSNGVIQTS